jgi:RHS repeat-associated protein
MGHTVQTQLASDPDGITYTATTYDGLGNPYQAWNPYRSTSDSTYGYTTYLVDGIGRSCLVVPPDFAAQAPNPPVCPTTAPLGDTFTSYDGNQTTVTDQVGNQRTTWTNGLARLTEVEEASNNSSYGYPTSYSYDPLGDLLSVKQNGSRARTYTYDSLSRLVCAANPEVQNVTCPGSATGTFPSGAITYTYDANGNLSSKVTPQANQMTGTAVATTSYTHDVLNRLTQKAYVGVKTNTVKFGYDGIALTACGQNPPNLSGATYLVGRRSAMCAGESGSNWSFDQMGRPLIESRINSSSKEYKFNVSYAYNLDGSLKTLTYPSGDIVSYTVGGAGRATQVSDSNSYVSYSKTTANPVEYAPSGSLASITNGYTSSPLFAGIVTSNVYNDRLQPILLSASVGSTAIFSLCYDFHLGVAISCPKGTVNAYSIGDNGNVFQVINEVDPTRSAAYIYDPLNRIAQAYTVTPSGQNCWGETYATAATPPGVLPAPSASGIDAWGNLTNRSEVSGMAGNCLTESLSQTASSQNHLSGLSYDIAGNVLNDGYGNTPTYDAENRIATDAGVTYYYDADGVRMEKSSGTMYWPSISGEYLTETNITGTIDEEYIYFNASRIARVDRPSGAVHYYFSNHLGSHTMVTSATGACEQDIEYFPYGGVITDHCPNVAQHYKFTGKERDTESGLDNFGARYNDSSVGRWMSPDAINVTDERLVNPANTLNKYIYGGNNPLKYIDPDGRDITVFYDSGAPAGHIMISAYNQQTGDFAFMSVGPQQAQNPGEVLHPFSGVPGTTEYNLPTSVDDLRKNFTAVTIQTNPEVAQQAIDAIRNGAGTGNWAALGNNCTTSCVRLLKDIGLSPGSNMGLPWTPERFWENIQAKYGQSSNSFSRFLASTMGAGSFGTPRNGTDTGNPRYGMNTFDWLMLMFRSAPQGTVTTTETYYINCQKNPLACK